MRLRVTSFGLPAALLAASLFGACSNTARGMKEDAAANSEKAKEASADAAAKADHAADDARAAAERATDAAKDAAHDASAAARSASESVEQKSKDAAVGTSGTLDGAAQTMEVKTALIADKTVDASGINVDTDGTSMIVTLKGHVPTAAQKTEAGSIAKSKAPSYKIVNDLVVR